MTPSASAKSILANVGGLLAHIKKKIFVFKTYDLPFDTSIIDFLIVAGVLLYGRG